jgi:hypothetical protein
MNTLHKRTVILRKERGVPVIAARRDRDGCLSFWCQHCEGWHFHGVGDGHRQANCWRIWSPYEAKGYILIGSTR